MIAAVLGWLGVAHAETIAGDLVEERGLIADEAGVWSARRWYVWQAVRVVAMAGARPAVATMLALAPLQMAWSAVFAVMCVHPPEGLAPVNAAGVVAGAVLGRRAWWLAVVVLVLGFERFPLAMALGIALAMGVISARIRKGTA